MIKANIEQMKKDWLNKLIKSRTEIEKNYPDQDSCVCCGAYVPEGRQVCIVCEMKGDVRKA